MQQVDFIQLLDEVPPYVPVQCSGFLNESEVSNNERKLAASTGSYSYSDCSISILLKPKLYCGSENCMRYSFFKITPTDQLTLNLSFGGVRQVHFRCCNCSESVKFFFLKFEPSSEVNPNNKTIFNVQKIGQFPRHGQPIPKKASKLVGKERDLFFKGSASENQGMGIGAFTYYRRVLDSQKNRIFDEIIKVLSLTSSNTVLISEIEEAKAETQFTKAVDRIKTSLPDGLNVQGHNPLTLLHSALSEGLHNDTDDECLELSHSIKLVLFEFSERLDSALKEDDKLSLAVKRLIAKKATQ